MYDIFSYSIAYGLRCCRALLQKVFVKPLDKAGFFGLLWKTFSQKTFSKASSVKSLTLEGDAIAARGDIDREPSTAQRRGQQSLATSSCCTQSAVRHLDVRGLL